MNVNLNTASRSGAALRSGVPEPAASPGADVHHGVAVVGKGGLDGHVIGTGDGGNGKEGLDGVSAASLRAPSRASDVPLSSALGMQVFVKRFEPHSQALAHSHWSLPFAAAATPAG